MDKTYFIEGGNGYGNGCGNGWGIDGLLAGALLGGGLWGNRGGYGNGGCCNGGGLANELATDTAAIQDRIGEEAIEAKVCNVEMAIGEAKYDNSLGQKDLQAAIMAGNNALATQLAQCCCNDRLDNQAARYEAQISNLKQTQFLTEQFCQVNKNIEKLGDKITFDALKERIRVQDALLFQASQENQTARIIAALSAPAA